MLPLRRKSSVGNPRDKQEFVNSLPKFEPITPL